MAQFFLISTTSVSESPEDIATAEERNRITQVLEKRDWLVWHWFEDLWLVVNPKNPIATSTLYREVRKIMGKNRFILITRVKPDDLVGFGPVPGWKWTDQNWPGHWDEEG
ncbi:MAG TPA: hypothetical protein VGM62_00195 [Chthoniobacterales bacterium]|jgi:hypothetical protein